MLVDSDGFEDCVFSANEFFVGEFECFCEFTVNDGCALHGCWYLDGDCVSTAGVFFYVEDWEACIDGDVS